MAEAGREQALSRALDNLKKRFGEGAVMRMKLDKTTRPLALFEKYLFDTLLASYPGNAGHTGTY